MRGEWRPDELLREGPQIVGLDVTVQIFDGVGDACHARVAATGGRCADVLGRGLPKPSITGGCSRRWTVDHHVAVKRRT
jgi:hypothetical protein